MKHQKFFEKLIFHVIGGRGGDGNKKFGAIGGRGGNVVLEATKNYSLNEVHYDIRSHKPHAMNGDIAAPSNLVAGNGQDYFIKVPVSCMVYNEMNRWLGEFTKPGDKLYVARGGMGGSAKTEFRGQPGMTKKIKLILKILADVGFVGFPNAGKSTLLTSMSKATPVIAPYAFTTLQPQVGHIYFDDQRKLSMADLPGLIEGAWNDEGLGHEFLRHVERTKLLLYVVDINGFQLDPMHAHRSAFECIMLLNKELEIYDSSLLFKPSILAINKMDSAGSEKEFEQLVKQLKNRKEIYTSYPESERPTILSRFSHIVPIAAKFRHKVDILAEVIRNSIDEMFTRRQSAKVQNAHKRLNQSLRVHGTKLKDY